jgi:NMD protein affecting ribosome stability and mRNA decay
MAHEMRIVTCIHCGKQKPKIWPHLTQEVQPLYHTCSKTCRASAEFGEPIPKNVSQRIVETRELKMQSAADRQMR